MDVLIVDDERGVLDALGLVLSDETFRVHKAESANQALCLLERIPVDVIVSDERMPGMPGTEFLTLVHERWPNTMRIVLTGYADVDAALRAINGGRVFRFLQKPCPPKRMKQTIHEALAERRRLMSSMRFEDAARQHLQTISTLEGASGCDGCDVQSELSGLSAADKVLLFEREKEVLRLLVSGRRIPSIAEILYISPHTVRNHLKSMYGKLHVHSQAELTARATGRG